MAGNHIASCHGAIQPDSRAPRGPVGLDAAGVWLHTHTHTHSICIECRLSEPHLLFSKSLLESLATGDSTASSRAHALAAG